MSGDPWDGVPGSEEDLIRRERQQTVRLVDLNGEVDENDDAIRTLRMLMAMHGETHTLWEITPSGGGAWDYVKRPRIQN